MFQTIPKLDSLKAILMMKIIFKTKAKSRCEINHFSQWYIPVLLSFLEHEREYETTYRSYKLLL
jgi:hypothetical protein